MRVQPAPGKAEQPPAIGGSSQLITQRTHERPALRSGALGYALRRRPLEELARDQIAQLIAARFKGIQRFECLLSGTDHSKELR